MSIASCYDKYRYTQESNRVSCRKYIQNNPWMRTLRTLRTRCNDIKCKDYKNYGGRGIKALISKEEIKKLWFRDKAYKLKHPSIDRKDNEGHYTFKNCQFMELGDNSKKAWKRRRNEKVIGK